MHVKCASLTAEEQVHIQILSGFLYDHLSAPGVIHCVPCSNHLLIFQKVAWQLQQKAHHISVWNCCCTTAPAVQMIKCR